MFDVAAPRVDGDGSFAGFIGSTVDITDQKKAQETLENSSGQLIAAQEKERSHLAERIARRHLPATRHALDRN